MKTQPIWRLKSIPIQFKTLDKDISVDVAIIGGGITGITTAQLLKNKGFKVAVLEGRKVGKGTTGQSTGNLYSITEYTLQELKSKYDLDTLREIIKARTEAIELIRKNVEQFKMDCDYKNHPLYLFQSDNHLDMENEISLAKEVGLSPSKLVDSNLPFQYYNGLIIPNQAQLNPLAYAQQLAKNIEDANCQIYEDTCVLDIKENGDIIILKTNRHSIKAKYAVHATHTPKGLQIQYHTTLGPYREYGIAVKLRDHNYPIGIYWGHFNNKKYSVRTYGEPSDPHLICVGNMHKVGQADDNRKNIRDLEEFVRQYFNVEAITHHWGGQNYKSADMLPYIGQLSSSSKQFLATGFSTDGLVYGTLSAKIISNNIANIKNDYSEIFKANRHQPIKAAKKFTKENVNVVEQLIGDFFNKGEDVPANLLQLGEGKVLQFNKDKYAVYKDSNGHLTILSTTCPHMGCTVHWNAAEKSWDCPCHGSRFDTNGRVIEGPALEGLTLVQSQTKSI